MVLVGVGGSEGFSNFYIGPTTSHGGPELFVEEKKEMEATTEKEKERKPPILSWGDFPIAGPGATTRYLYPGPLP